MLVTARLGPHLTLQQVGWGPRLIKHSLRSGLLVGVLRVETLPTSALVHLLRDVDVRLKILDYDDDKYDE